MYINIKSTAITLVQMDTLSADDLLGIGLRKRDVSKSDEFCIKNKELLCI